MKTKTIAMLLVLVLASPASGQSPGGPAARVLRGGVEARCPARKALYKSRGQATGSASATILVPGAWCEKAPPLACTYVMGTKDVSWTRRTLSSPSTRT